MSLVGARLSAVRDYAPLVRESLRFALRELSGRRSVGLYRPRGTRVRVCARHNLRTRDWDAGDNLPLREIFGEHCYEPPPPVDAALRRLDRPPRIADLGGHLGYFGAYVIDRYPDAHVVSFEPEPSHAALLRRCIEVNRAGARWELVEACAHTEDGALPFAAGRSVNSFLASFGEDEEGVAEVVEVAARDVFPYLADADLAKIDVEGAEWALLMDARFADARPPAVVLEYHSVGCPAENAKRAVAERLSALGYRVEFPPGDPNPDVGAFWGRGVVWGWIPQSSSER